jgi:hypothetical protein
MAALVGLLYAWPMLYVAWIQGTEAFIRPITGDAYHYLAIGRKAQQFGIYTYDGVHTTNGFHPLWQYFLRGVFRGFGLVTHTQQAVAAIASALVAATLGVVLTAAAIIRFTRMPILALLVVPGVYYLVVGVHVRNLSIWATLDGMESAFSVLFAGLFFEVASRVLTGPEAGDGRVVRLAKATGLVLPFLILSRLDDFFILPALAIALYLTDLPLRDKLKAILWMGLPSSLAILAYLIYNALTVGSAMPLSGSTKSGFVGFVTGYLLAGTHFPPIFDIKAMLTGKESDGLTILDNSFRFIEMFYPMLIAAYTAVIVWAYGRRQPEGFLIFGVAVFILFKTGYNFLMVHPWHQSGWYYLFTIVSLSVFAAFAGAGLKPLFDGKPAVRYGAWSLLLGLALLSGAQFYGRVAYAKPDSIALLWQNKDALRAELLKQGVTGIVNFDDGITAFLLDFPSLHGFAFATDKEAQKAEREGRLLSLAFGRKMNAIVGQAYLAAADLPDDEEKIRDFLKKSVAAEAIRNDADRFRFFLLAQEKESRVPVIGFAPKATPPAP